jgi:hypothetical protein
MTCAHDGRGINPRPSSRLSPRGGGTVVVRAEMRQARLYRRAVLGAGVAMLELFLGLSARRSLRRTEPTT